VAFGVWRLAVGGWRISSIVIVLVLEKGAQVSAKLIDPDGVAAPQIGDVMGIARLPNSSNLAI
jgi:hypothetical protein